MISQCSRSRQICFVRVDASLGTSATDINPATNPAFFFFPPHGALVSYNWTNFKLQHERILNSTELYENFQNSPKLFRKIEKQQDQMREETT